MNTTPSVGWSKQQLLIVVVTVAIIFVLGGLTFYLKTGSFAGKAYTALAGEAGIAEVSTLINNPSFSVPLQANMGAGVKTNAVGFEFSYRPYIAFTASCQDIEVSLLRNLAQRFTDSSIVPAAESFLHTFTCTDDPITYQRTVSFDFVGFCAADCPEALTSNTAGEVIVGNLDLPTAAQAREVTVHFNRFEVYSIDDTDAATNLVSPASDAVITIEEPVVGEACSVDADCTWPTTCSTVGVCEVSKEGRFYQAVQEEIDRNPLDSPLRRVEFVAKVGREMKKLLQS